MSGTRPALERPSPAPARRLLAWPDFLAALMRGPVTQVRAITGRVPGGWRTRPRIAPRYEVHYLWCAPQADLAVNLLAGERTVPPGTLVWVPPGVPYEVRVASTRRSEYLHRLRFALHRGGRLLSPLAEATPVPGAGFVGDLVHRAAVEDAREDPAAAHRLRCVLGLLAGEVRARLETPAADAPGLSPAQLAVLRSQLAGDPGARPTPADLARQLGYAPGYFTRLFTAAVGMPPRRWLKRERVHRAAERLLETPAPVAEVALEFGYDNPFLFSRQFREVLGCPPTAWRERHR